MPPASPFSSSQKQCSGNFRHGAYSSGAAASGYVSSVNSVYTLGGLTQPAGPLAASRLIPRLAAGPLAPAGTVGILPTQ